MSGFSALAWLVFAGFIVLMAVHQRRRTRQSLHEAFASRMFQTPDGPIAGSKMRIVKEVFDLPGNQTGTSVNNAFLYCTGPGPSYYVVIAQVRNGWTQTYTWVVRPLTEDRMRGALMGDQEALHATFSDQLPDTLQA